MAITWEKPQNKKRLLSSRKEASLAYTELIIKLNKQILTDTEKQVIRQLTQKLALLIPVFDRNDSMIQEVKQIVQFVARNRPQRSNVKILDKYNVLYHGNVKGVRHIDVPRKAVVKLLKSQGHRIVSHGESIASKSYPQLSGEVLQYVAKEILDNLVVNGERVTLVFKPDIGKMKGKRVDDWIIQTRNGSTIPAEIKASRRLGYFNSAFKQIKNMEQHGRRGVFIGFYLRTEPKKAFVILVDKEFTLSRFRKALKALVKIKLSR